MADIKDYLRDIAARDGANLLPAVSGSDNGKVLKVVGGVWSKAAETVELPAVTTSDNGKILKVVGGVWTAASAT